MKPHRPILIFLAVAWHMSATAFAQAPVSGGTSPAKDIPVNDLEWTVGKELKKDVVQVITKQLRPGSGRPDGSLTAPPLVTSFPAGETYEAELGSDFLEDRAAASFLFSGQVRENPAQGAIVSIAGATIGFKLQSKEGYRSTARILVRQKSEKEGETWKVLPGAVAVRSEEPMAVVRMPRMEVRLHREQGTWDLYVGGLSLAEGLELEKSASRASIQVNLNASEVPAVIEDLRVNPAPAEPVLTPATANRKASKRIASN